NHPALKSSYRGWNGGPATDHLHNWFDATNEASTYPSDLNGHGTHTMGTIVGQNGIGIAPGARWMAAKGLNGAGYGLYSWLHAAFQFMLAPAGNPAYAPDIVSNSWGSEDGLDTEFAADIAALRAAGIVALFANGNKGPAAGTVNSPASLPGAFGVGATDPDDDVAYFSSRGPSPFGEVRPHLSAPGVGVLSTFPGGSYATASGTSMATPHAAGAAALVLSANPSLSVFSVTHALTSTAVPLSTTLPNNASGWGRVDAWNAVLSVISTGVITGRVLDGAQPISGALVVAHSGPIQAQAFSDANGYYAIRAVAGIYTVTASAFGYQPATSTPRIVITNSVTTVNFNLSALPSGIARGVVTDVASGAYLTQTVVRALGTPESSLASGGSPARYYALNLPAGVYTIEARLLGYIVQTRTVIISDGVISELNFALTPTQRIAFVDSGAWYYGSAARQYKQALDDLALAYDELRVKRLPADTPTITQLLRYDTVIWSAPFDSPEYIGAGDVISRYLASGRNLLLSGQDVAFYDGGGFLFHPYFNRLNAYYLADDVPSRVITGAQQSLLAGKVLTIAGGDGADNQYLVDAVRVVNPDHGRGLGIYRAGGPALETAGVYAEQCLTYRSAYFAFGLEAIDSAADRADTLRRVLNAFDAPRPTVGVELLSRDAYHTTTPVGAPGSVITHLARIRHTGEAGLTDTFTLTLSGNQWPAIISPAVVELAPCSSTLALITVTIPLSATWDAQDTVTVTAVSHISPSATSVISFSSKTPAGILLVDDDRFYNREQDYLEALAAQGNRADRWDTRWGFGIADSPPITLLRLYPLVIWFNGYDWFDPIQLAEQDILQQYLDEGGRLFFSSQAALFQTELSPFNRHYLGVAAIDFEDTFSRVVGVPGHVIGAGFANSSLLNELNQFPYAWNLSTAVQPLTGTQVILRGDSGQPAGLARAGASTSSATSSADWRTGFMPFAFEALTTTAKADLMNRAAGWLSWLGASSLFPHEDQIAAGDTVTFTIALRADDVISPALAITPTVTISAPVAEHLFVVSSTLTGWSDHHAGEWSGALQAGMALTWTFVATTSASLSAGEMLTAWLRVSISQPDLAFTRHTATRVGGPRVISSLTVAPASPQWGGLITAIARMTNVGSIAAPGARMTSVVPIALSLLTPTVQGPSIGSVTVSRNRIDWTGALAAGAAITLTYQMSAPAISSPQRDFYHAVLVDDGSGALSQSARWISPGAQNRFLPLVLR
ncbi:MAG: S8 family serine peptidase, partial [Candidatus Roseilinea sp.]|uniref:S8 family serine peptidase n=1 Tax=Candidatus Roseilinea sp. TaxID=2838777 RepID=UPI0040498C7E